MVEGGEPCRPHSAFQDCSQITHVFLRSASTRRGAWLSLPMGKHWETRQIELLLFKSSWSRRERDIKPAIATVPQDMQGRFSRPWAKPFSGCQSSVFGTQFWRKNTHLGWVLGTGAEIFS